MIRWWVFEGGSWQIQRDASGTPTGLHPPRGPRCYMRSDVFTGLCDITRSTWRSHRQSGWKWTRQSAHLWHSATYKYRSGLLALQHQHNDLRRLSRRLAPLGAGTWSDRGIGRPEPRSTWKLNCRSMR